MKRTELFHHITNWFSENMETAETELHYDTPFHLLIAVILSAQCTDKRVNIYTPAIFARFPEPADLAAASFDEVYEMIKSISFPNNKAKHLIGMAGKLVSDFGGVVPSWWISPFSETLCSIFRQTNTPNILPSAKLCSITRSVESSGIFLQDESFAKTSAAAALTKG